MLANTIPDIATRPVAKPGRWRLEVNSVFDTGKIRSSQVSGSTNHLGNDQMKFAKHGFGELAGRNGGVGIFVSKQSPSIPLAQRS